MHRVIGDTKCWFHLKFSEPTGVKHLYKKFGHIQRKKNLFESQEKLGWGPSHSFMVLFLQVAFPVPVPTRSGGI